MLRLNVGSLYSSPSTPQCPLLSSILSDRLESLHLEDSIESFGGRRTARAGRVDRAGRDVEVGDRPRARRRGGMLWCSRHGAVRSARETGRREPRRAARPDDRHAVEPRSVDALGLGGAPGAPAAHEVVVPEALVDEVQRGYHPPTHHARHLSVLEAEREVDGALVVRLLVGVRAEGAVDEEEDAARLRARRARWRHRRGCAPVRRRGEPAGIARPAQKTVGVR
mmetsp:Transcript_20308/g.81137  ORF Transcript_20308/g.81137 Transcript_20308/m.81137 type:complete len:224 (-) Transcript_20308:373-1044(-)